MDALSGSLAIAGSGLQAQSTRLRVVSENLANAQTTGEVPGADAFRRKLISLQSLSHENGLNMVGVKSITRDMSDFRVEREPSHPAADANGDVKYPNVSTMIELADMREAGRNYEANLQVMRQARQLISMTIDMLRER
ncbi:MAG: flagellar basal body rod protein FlgC [Notoacmeibacter sp.]